ncbi:MAG TPA: hypothetical protein VJ246_01485 [Patescibacteria group bacterium]|nr:hypothetical protein [Patescibacteria group bacterium]
MKQKKDRNIEEKDEEKRPRKRTFPSPEEHAKRGRWFTILLLLLTLFFGYVSWSWR